MTEFFIVAHSGNAPFVSDTSHAYQSGDTAEEAMATFVEKYSHPCGLHSAELYRNADDYHKNAKPWAVWRKPAPDTAETKAP